MFLMLTNLFLPLFPIRSFQYQSKENQICYLICKLCLFIIFEVLICCIIENLCWITISWLWMRSYDKMPLIDFHLKDWKYWVKTDCLLHLNVYFFSFIFPIFWWVILFIFFVNSNVSLIFNFSLWVLSYFYLVSYINLSYYGNLDCKYLNHQGLRSSKGWNFDD